MRAINCRVSSRLTAITSSLLTALAIATATVDFAAAQVSAGCQASWVPTFGAQPGTSGAVGDMVVFDDGTGPALYAAGGFMLAGNTTAMFIAKWDGTRWTALSGGTNSEVDALAVFDDGSGPALYAGGMFTQAGGMAANHIAKWDGHDWTALDAGTNGGINALAVFDDGSGLALYAGGFFSTAGGVSASCIAKWNGSAWSALGSGVAWPNPPFNNNIGSVSALAAYDDGTGEALYVGGRYTTAGGQPVNGIARWNGSNWSSMGSGLNGVTGVDALVPFDDGGGLALYMGGTFTVVSGTPLGHIAKWDGSNWSALGTGVDGYVKSLAVFDDGHGAALYAGGSFANAGGTPAQGIAEWDGSNWSALGSGLIGGAPNQVAAIAAFDDGHGVVLYVGGSFVVAGNDLVNNTATWDGATWSAIGNGLTRRVRVLSVLDDGHGPELYACGDDFTSVGGITVDKIAKWSGSEWTDLVSTLSYVDVLTALDDGSGAALYAAGNVTNASGIAVNVVARFSGSSWSQLGGALNGKVHALAVFDDGAGPALYAGGEFTTAGGTTVNSVAKWDGASWSRVGAGMNPNAAVWALTAFDDGSGPALYAGGRITKAGTVATRNIAKWNGSTWSRVGHGVDSNGVYVLTAFDDGTGPALYAGGSFTVAGGGAANNIAKWDGSGWTALGSGVSGDVHALAAFDDGSGPVLCAGGSFLSAGGVAASFIAKWNGSHWSALGNGVNNSVHALTVFDDSTGSALFVGGSFLNAFDSGDSYLAKWGCSFVKTGTAYCTAGTTSHGCVPSISATGGASASASSGFTISVANVEGQRNGIFFYGIHGQVASPWSANGSSLLCVKSPLQRMSVLTSGGTTGLCDGVLAEDWNAFRAAHATALGQPFIRGETVWAQGWFRDPPGLKTTKLSNGLVFAIGP